MPTGNGTPSGPGTPGILHLPVGVKHGRIAPADELRWLVEHYWWVAWDVETPATSEVLAYPSVHVVIEGAGPRIVGVPTAKFVRRLEGAGQAFGIKFRPGMFHVLWQAPVWPLTDDSVPLRGTQASTGLAEALEGPSAPAERAVRVDRALSQLPLVAQPRGLLARDLVERVRVDRTLVSVAELARLARQSERALQRLFREFVGVSPKWVVRRFRLQEAAVRLARSETTVVEVAAELGYFDQAHFVHDWTSVVGQTPVAFARQARARRNV